MWSLGPFAFAAPLMLAGLAALPLLWFLLRAIPPTPVRVQFPALRLLMGLAGREETPARTPLWLVLLRMGLAALLVLGLAHPLLHPAPVLGGDGPLLVVLDDGWGAAPGWDATLARLDELLAGAEREGRDTALVTTAIGAGADAPSLEPAASLRLRARSFLPHPWATDRDAAAKRLASLPFRPGRVVWLSDAIDDAAHSAERLGRRLTSWGQASVLLPDDAGRAHLLAPGPGEAGALTVRVERVATGGPDPIDLRGYDIAGRGIAEAKGEIAAGSPSADIVFSIPLELRNRLDRVDLTGETGAGAVWLLDESARRRLVGLVAAEGAGSDQPLLSPTFYLERALRPFGEIRRGDIASLPGEGVSMIVLPDGPVDAGPAHERLSRWVEDGGVLLRFAGPGLAAAEPDGLLPVPLRQGGRSLGGALTWTTPAHLAAFPDGTPLSGLEIPQDVTVDRQLLAEPGPELANTVWARLADGTPLVTGARRGKGWLVLVHTTAGAGWSNLALSGLFPDMLRRISRLSDGTALIGKAELAPWRVLDGFGRLVEPSSVVQPIETETLPKLVPGPDHPPGLYGDAESHVSFNLGTATPPPMGFGALPPGLAPEHYGTAAERDLRPALLDAALVLLLADLLVGLWLRGLLSWRGRARFAALFLVSVIAAGAARADDDAFAIEATQSLRLAYVRTGDGELDRISKAGLNGLAAVLTRRTAVETAEPLAVDVEHDELIFFPLIYWPIGDVETPLSPGAAERVNRYLATGGTILFDSGDHGMPGGRDTAQRLNRLLVGVHIPALVQLPADHVLTKSFYLMQDFPGRWAGGALWVEPADDRVNDGVSTVVFGSNGWAAAWAVDDQGTPLFPVVPGGERQREQAYRFGVNMVMYALTGNYKADQVHLPAILERLGQ